MLNEKLPKFLFVLGLLGWITVLVLILKPVDNSELNTLKQQQLVLTTQVKDILIKEVDAVYSKCKKSNALGEKIKWNGQFHLAEKYCQDPIISNDINSMAKCKEIKRCKTPQL
ncbi:hypothetical protein [Photobacterium kishitanii]|uniref:hypothetical protein n=1 Tax=Photobacterium kishitanii TaxID=318456 RepID=UPI00071AEAF0|nr:hypothetical protein [Photobacterium kishitanii]